MWAPAKPPTTNPPSSPQQLWVLTARILRRWSREADLLRLHGCGPLEYQLLDTIGITGIAQLSMENPRDLYDRLRAASAEREDLPPPAYAWVESWVAQAKHLPPVVEW